MSRLPLSWRELIGMGPLQWAMLAGFAIYLALAAAAIVAARWVTS